MTESEGIRKLDLEEEAGKSRGAEIQAQGDREVRRRGRQCP